MNLGKFGTLDFGGWVYGLAAAFIGGGANSIVTALSIYTTDPSHFNTSTGAFWVIVVRAFTIAGVISAAAYLTSKPVPLVKTTVTTEEKTTVLPVSRAGTATTIVSTVEETKVEPITPASEATK